MVKKDKTSLQKGVKANSEAAPRRVRRGGEKHKEGPRVQYKKRCLLCRKVGHTVAECRENTQRDRICYNCGSTGHTLSKCPQPRNPEGLPFAKCYVCGGTGHLSSQCPKNDKGIYPEGGCCRMCGSIYHLKQDCPLKSKKAAAVASLAVMDKSQTSGDADIDVEQKEDRKVMDSRRFALDENTVTLPRDKIPQKKSSTPKRIVF